MESPATGSANPASIGIEATLTPSHGDASKLLAPTSSSKPLMLLRLSGVPICRRLFTAFRGQATFTLNLLRQRPKTNLRTPLVDVRFVVDRDGTDQTIFIPIELSAVALTSEIGRAHV